MEKSLGTSLFFQHFFYIHTRTQTHQTNSLWRMNLDLLSPSPLPTMWAILHQRMLERVALLVQTLVVKYIH